MEIFRKVFCLPLLLVALVAGTETMAKDELPTSVAPAPDRERGAGPFDRLVIRGGTLIDGTGAPPFGPVDIVVEGNRITEVRVVARPRLTSAPLAGPRRVHTKLTPPANISCRAS